MGHRILCFGDSNTYGYDPRSYLGGRYPESVRWTGRLKAEGWEIFNEGENGRSIPRLDWEIAAVWQTLLRTNAEALVMMLGSNDLLQRPGITAEICARRMEVCLTAVRENTPAALKLLLAAPPPMELGAWIQGTRLIEESRRLADCYEELAQLLDIGFANTRDWGIGLTYDGVHFSEEGHKTFEKRMSEALLALFQKDDDVGFI